MSDLRTAAQQALMAWDNDENGTMDQPMSSAMEALRAALQQPEQEPVASLMTNVQSGDVEVVWNDDGFDKEMWHETPLYTHPPRRTGLPHCERSCEANAFKIEIRRLKAALEESADSTKPVVEPEPQRTLTDEVIADLWHQNGGFHHHFARAIERWLRGQK